MRDFFSFRSVVLIPSIFLTGLAVLTVAWWTMAQVERTDYERAQLALDQNLRLLKSDLSRLGSEYRVNNGNLYLGDSPLADQSAIVDRVNDILGGVATIFQDDTRIVTNVKNAEGKRAIGTKLAAGPVYDKVLGGGQTFRGQAEILGRKHLTIYEPIKATNGSVIGILFVGIPVADIDEFESRLWREAALGILVSLIAASILIAVSINFALSPLGHLQKAMDVIANGRLDITVPGVNRKDEIGHMAQTVLVFRNNSRRILEIQAEQDRLKQSAEAERIQADREKQEVATRAAQDRRASLNRLAEDFDTSVNMIVRKLSDETDDLRATAKSMTEIAAEASRQCEFVAQASGRASGNVHTVASAAEEFTASIGEIGLQVGQSTQIASSARRQAEDTNQRVQALADAVARIGDVVGLISSIAAQTNLLALNATIEAARAGDSGKGFAVVASEVKVLSNQTAQATEEIRQKILEMQTLTGDSVVAVSEIVGTVEKIDATGQAIAAAIEQQSAATKEIARSIQNAARDTAEVSSSIQTLTGIAAKVGEESHHVLDAAQDLAQNSATLKQDVEQFVNRVRQG
jgi:methyl-accepting chemotaxis protein